MPEGPSIVILKEEANRFLGKTIARVEGNTTIEKERLVSQRIEAIRSWGKHFLIELDDFSLKVHFLLFGSYRINQRKDATPRLSLGFDTGELNFYACSVRFIEEPLDLVYDWHIIKNEVLFRIKVHPMSRVGPLPAPKLRALVAEARQYSFDFFEWKKAFVLKKHWLAHTKRTCPRCDIPLLKAHLGKTHRRSFFCERCQVRYE